MAVEAVSMAASTIIPGITTRLSTNIRRTSLDLKTRYVHHQSETCQHIFSTNL